MDPYTPSVHEDNVRLKSLLRELEKEHFWKDNVASTLVCNFWKKFELDSDAERYLDNFVSAVEELKVGVDSLSLGTSIPCSGQGVGSANVLSWLETELSITKPDHIYDIVVQILKHSVDLWTQEKGSEEMDVTERMELEGPQLLSKPSGNGSNEGTGCGKFLEQFLHLVSLLKSLNLLHFFADYAVADIMRIKVKEHVHQACSMEFDSPMLEETLNSLRSKVVEWINFVYGSFEQVKRQWFPKVEYIGYKEYAELRISELFDILVEYPDSEPALCDLKQCMDKVQLRSFLITSLKSVFEKRLLHPGANTSDIITQYISSVKGLRLLDPSGVVLEQVCTPVREYLKTREDTVRCIVASLTDDSSNELADELATGEPVLLDLNEESDGEEQDFSVWEPDPVDADPEKTSKSRQTSDIISLLVSIYGSREMFVNEYRTLLADRLLQSLVYNTSREVRNLELLKLRFGEGNLNFCEVMIKDITDSKRINAHIVSQFRKENKEPEEQLEVNAFVLSHIFWPTFREEKLKLPDFIEKELEKYVECYKSSKVLRTLEWKYHLGLVQVDLELADRKLSLSVSPIRAAIIHYFQDQSTWSVEALSTTLASTPSTIRRHLGYWVGQGVLREDHNDTFTVIERQTEAIKSCPTSGDVDDEEESPMVSADDQRESDFQIFWSYITGMLKTLGKMKLDRILSMLKMFATPGAGGKECSAAELKTFLDKKVREQQLIVSGGEYQLPQ